MKTRNALIAAGLALAAAPAFAMDALPAGIWTNTEDAYFAEEEGREQVEWTGIEVDEEGKWRFIDAFRHAQSDWTDGPIPGLSPREGGGWQIGKSELRKARPLSCWVAVRKFAAKPDGSEDWGFVGDLPIFDQGGRILVPGEGLAPDVTIRVRNVTWAKGSRNKPVRALYIHKQDPVRAESYSWAEPDTSVIGINLRWVQASCSERPSQIDGVR